MKMEYMHAALPADANLQGAIQALVADGWQMIPGVTPVCIYHLQRPEPQPQIAGIASLGGMAIDDTKIHIIRGNGTTE